LFIHKKRPVGIDKRLEIRAPAGLPKFDFSQWNWSLNKSSRSRVTKTYCVAANIAFITLPLPLFCSAASNGRSRNWQCAAARVGREISRAAELRWRQRYVCVDVGQRRDISHAGRIL
jgi:hypothetical protein